MSKEDKINIKLEVCRDKTSGKLSITARFNKNAPNIFKDKYGYIWTPTAEETDFLNEAFQMLSFDSQSLPITEPIFRKEKNEEIKRTPIIERKERPIPKTVEIEESDVFEVASNDIEEDKSEKFDISKEINNRKKPEDDYNKKQEDEKILVEADPAEIDAALRKHTKDESIREVDEQTIIDKVLSQKKKGRWSRK